MDKIKNISEYQELFKNDEWLANIVYMAEMTYESGPYSQEILNDLDRMPEYGIRITGKDIAAKGGLFQAINYYRAVIHFRSNISKLGGPDIVSNELIGTVEGISGAAKQENLASVVIGSLERDKKSIEDRLVEVGKEKAECEKSRDNAAKNANAELLREIDKGWAQFLDRIGERQALTARFEDTKLLVGNPDVGLDKLCERMAEMARDLAAKNNGDFINSIQDQYNNAVKELQMRKQLSAKDRRIFHAMISLAMRQGARQLEASKYNAMEALVNAKDTDLAKLLTFMEELAGELEGNPGYEKSVRDRLNESIEALKAERRVLYTIDKDAFHAMIDIARGIALAGANKEVEKAENDPSLLKKPPENMSTIFSLYGEIDKFSNFFNDIYFGINNFTTNLWNNLIGNEPAAVVQSLSPTQGVNIENPEPAEEPIPISSLSADAEIAPSASSPPAAAPRACPGRICAGSARCP